LTDFKRRFKCFYVLLVYVYNSAPVVYIIYVLLAYTYYVSGQYCCGLWKMSLHVMFTVCLYG